MEKRFYNLYEAADLLGVGYSTLRLHIQQGRIPFVVIGKRKFIPSATITQIEQSASVV